MFSFYFLLFTPFRCWLYVRVLSNFRPRYLGHSSETSSSSSICMFKFLFASRSFRCNTFVTDLLGFSLNSHFRKYVCLIYKTVVQRSLKFRERPRKSWQLVPRHPNIPNIIYIFLWSYWSCQQYMSWRELMTAQILGVIHFVVLYNYLFWHWENFQ